MFEHKGEFPRVTLRNLFTKSRKERNSHMTEGNSHSPHQVRNGGQEWPIYLPWLVTPIQKEITKRGNLKHVQEPLGTQAMGVVLSKSWKPSTTEHHPGSDFKGCQRLRGNLSSPTRGALLDHCLTTVVVRMAFSWQSATVLQTTTSDWEGMISWEAPGNIKQLLTWATRIFLGSSIMAISKYLGHGEVWPTIWFYEIASHAKCPRTLQNLPLVTLREIQPCSRNVSGCLPCLQTKLPPSWMMFLWPVEILAWVCSEQPSPIIFSPFLVAPEFFPLFQTCLGTQAPSLGARFSPCFIWGLVSQIFQSSVILGKMLYSTSPWGPRASFKSRLVPQPSSKEEGSGTGLLHFLGQPKDLQAWGKSSRQVGQDLHGPWSTPIFSSRRYKDL